MRVRVCARQVDQFSKMHDFARAYGSLCWNLSKVIPRKDLPKYVCSQLPYGATGQRDAWLRRTGARGCSCAASLTRCAFGDAESTPCASPATPPPTPCSQHCLTWR